MSVRPPYLIRRGAVYWFRRRVPKAQRRRFHSSALSWSLRTSDFQIAVRWVRWTTSFSDALFAMLGTHALSPLEQEEVYQAHLAVRFSWLQADVTRDPVYPRGPEFDFFMRDVKESEAAAYDDFLSGRGSPCPWTPEELLKALGFPPPYAPTLLQLMRCEMSRADSAAFAALAKYMTNQLERHPTPIPELPRLQALYELDLIDDERQSERRTFALEPDQGPFASTVPTTTDDTAGRIACRQNASIAGPISDGSAPDSPMKCKHGGAEPTDAKPVRHRNRKNRPESVLTVSGVPLTRRRWRGRPTA